MKHAVYLYDELREIAPFLAELEKTNTFSVPAGYFLDLDIEILKRVKSDLLYLLPAPESSVLTVPDEYFENLTANILQKIKNTAGDHASEELQHFPHLYAAKDKNVFSVPEGYFKTFSDGVLSAVKSPAKVVVMKKRNMVWHCAAAAILTGIMAISALWLTDKPSLQNTDLVALKAIAPNVANTGGYFEYKDEQQINKGISDLSDTDIIGYLETTGGPIEDEMLASVIQEKELPAEQDYLIDENTLENFFDVKNLPNDQN